ncbi:MAG: hypothetical protein JSV88_31565 [Candidatus Aminicenantes bacterium]|nr:MAG: hypothetical protein JSV88_31565 [Candidatus Aminicenantes bacterium]
MKKKSEVRAAIGVIGIILILAVFWVLTRDNTPTSDEKINCLQRLLENQIQPLTEAEEIDKQDLSKKLNQIKTGLEECKIPESPLTKDIFDKLEEFIKEVDALEETQDLDRIEYSLEIKDKINRLIEEIKPEPPVPEKAIPQPAAEVKIPSKDDTTHLLLYIVIILIFLSLIFNAVFYFLYLKGTTETIESMQLELRKAIADSKHEVNNFEIRLNDRLDEELKNTGPALHKKLQEVDEKIDKMIIYVKRMEEDLSSKPVSPAPRSLKDTEVVPDPGIYPGDGDEPGIRFSQDSNQQGWRKRVISLFNRNKEKINVFLTAIEMEEKSKIKQWLEHIDKKIQETSGDEEDFFRGILYSQINALRANVSKKRYEEFKDMFLRYFLKELNIEEFGTRGDMMDFSKYEIIGAAGVPGREDIVREVDSPGYKDLRTGKVLYKAYVKV